MSTEVVRLGAIRPEYAPDMAAALMTALLAEVPMVQRADTFSFPPDHPTVADLRRDVPLSPVWPFMDEHPDAWLIVAVAVES